MNVGTGILSLAYAILVADVGLWLADYMRPILRAQSVVRSLAWAGAALAAGYLLAEAVLERRPLFLTISDFLAAAVVGMLAVAPIAGRGKGTLVASLALALAALTHVLGARPDAPPTVDQHTLLYVAQAGLHALGMGGCVAALLGRLGAAPIQRARRQADNLGVALMGTGFVLASAWAWLNWGVVWRSDPRLNLMASGWLCIVAGRLLRPGDAQRHSVWDVLGVALMLVGVFGAEWIAAGWPGLPFVAW